VAEYLHPGVFVEEKPSGAKPIEAASTSTACFAGTVGRGRPSYPTFVSSWFQFKDAFGDLDKAHDLPLAVYQFFQNGGSRAYILRVVKSDPQASDRAITAADPATNAIDKAVADAIKAGGNADAIKKAKTDATTKAIADASKPESAALILTGTGGQRIVPIKAAGEGLWGNDLKISVTETRADVLALAAVKAENDARATKNKTLEDSKKLPMLDLPVVHFDLQVSLEGQAVERWTNLDGNEDGDKFYASVINRFSSHIAIPHDDDGEFPQGAPVFAAPATTPTTPATTTTTPPTTTTTPPTTTTTTTTTPPTTTTTTTTAPAASTTPAAATDSTKPRNIDIKLGGGLDGGDPIAIDFGKAFETLDRLSDISILVVPGVEADTAATAASYVSGRAGHPGVGGDMVYVMDPPPGGEWNFGPRDGRNSAEQIAVITKFCQTFSPKDTYTSLYFPWVEIPDPYSKVSGATRFAPPSGMVAGLYARTDNTRGVWKAPAGTEASMLGAVGVAAQVSDQDQDTLNPIGVNCIRQFPASGIVSWGSRTLGTLSNPEYRYVPVRRMANFLKVSLYRGTQWVVFEPNDEPLWAAIRFNLNAFMGSLFRVGAFQGAKPEEAFFVKCDKDNNTQATIDQGQVHILVGFAPLKPAEFVIITLQQLIKQ
jgi:hypothetical protein